MPCENPFNHPEKLMSTLRGRTLQTATRCQMMDVTKDTHLSPNIPHSTGDVPLDLWFVNTHKKKGKPCFIQTVFVAYTVQYLCTFASEPYCEASLLSDAHMLLLGQVCAVSVLRLVYVESVGFDSSIDIIGCLYHTIFMVNI